MKDSHYLVTYNDSADLPRAWGKAPTEEAADTEAKRQLEAYKAKQAELGEPAEEYKRRVQRYAPTPVFTKTKNPGPGLAKTIGPEGRRKRAPSTAAANGPKTAKAGDLLQGKALTRLRKLTRLEIPGTVQPKPKGELDHARSVGVHRLRRTVPEQPTSSRPHENSPPRVVDRRARRGTVKKALEDLLAKIEFAALTGTDLALHGSEVQVLYEHLKWLPRINTRHGDGTRTCGRCGASFKVVGH